MTYFLILNIKTVQIGCQLKQEICFGFYQVHKYFFTGATTGCTSMYYTVLQCSTVQQHCPCCIVVYVNGNEEWDSKNAMRNNNVIAITIIIIKLLWLSPNNIYSIYNKL